MNIFLGVTLFVLLTIASAEKSKGSKAEKRSLPLHSHFDYSTIGGIGFDANSNSGVEITRNVGLDGGGFNGFNEHAGNFGNFDLTSSGVLSSGLNGFGSASFDNNAGLVTNLGQNLGYGSNFGFYGDAGNAQHLVKTSSEVRTITQKVPVAVPQPYQVIVTKKVPVPQPFTVHVPKAVPVPVHIKVPVEIPKPYAVKVPHKVPVPVQVKVPVQVPKPYAVYVTKTVPIQVDKPVFVRVPHHVKVPVPQAYPVKVPYPVVVADPYPVIVRVPQLVNFDQGIHAGGISGISDGISVIGGGISGINGGISGVDFGTGISGGGISGIQEIHHDDTVQLPSADPGVSTGSDSVTVEALSRSYIPAVSTQKIQKTTPILKENKEADVKVLTDEKSEVNLSSNNDEGSIKLEPSLQTSDVVDEKN